MYVSLLTMRLSHRLMPFCPILISCINVDFICFKNEYRQCHSNQKETHFLTSAGVLLKNHLFLIQMVFLDYGNSHFGNTHFVKFRYADGCNTDICSNTKQIVFGLFPLQWKFFSSSFVLQLWEVRHFHCILSRFLRWKQLGQIYCRGGSIEPPSARPRQVTRKWSFPWGSWRVWYLSIVTDSTRKTRVWTSASELQILPSRWVVRSVKLWNGDITWFYENWNEAYTSQKCFL